jgi:hypothetical protein
MGGVSHNDRWMPNGFRLIEEAQLHKAALLIDSAYDRLALQNWWLADPRPTSRTPTWDIASTCSIAGRRGLLLVEAKAHHGELVNEACGKRLAKDSSNANHRRIAGAIGEANEGLRLATGLEWHLSSDRCYQMSNRFAWAWKLCTLGYPVALVYLGFIQADDMSKPFGQASEWDSLVRQHSNPLFPGELWGQTVSVDGVPLVPLIRTSMQSLEAV